MSSAHFSIHRCDAPGCRNVSVVPQSWTAESAPAWCGWINLRSPRRFDMNIRGQAVACSGACRDKLAHLYREWQWVSQASGKRWKRLEPFPMKDSDDLPSKAAPRTIECRVCRYAIDAAFQNDDGSKRGVEFDDIIDAARSHDPWRMLGTAIGLAVEDIVITHRAPCGGECPGGPVDPVSSPPPCVGRDCPACAAFRASLNQQ